VIESILNVHNELDRCGWKLLPDTPPPGTLGVYSRWQHGGPVKAVLVLNQADGYVLQPLPFDRPQSDIDFGLELLDEDDDERTEQR